MTWRHIEEYSLKMRFFEKSKIDLLNYIQRIYFGNWKISERMVKKYFLDKQRISLDRYSLRITLITYVYDSI